MKRIFSGMLWTTVLIFGFGSGVILFLAMFVPSAFIDFAGVIAQGLGLK